MNNQKGFAPILIILIALVVVGGGGVLAWKYKLVDKTYSSVPTPILSLAHTPSPTLIDVSIECDKKQDQKTKDNCYYSAATAKNDLFVCDKIQDQEKKDFCYFDILLLKKKKIYLKRIYLVVTNYRRRL